MKLEDIKTAVLKKAISRLNKQLKIKGYSKMRKGDLIGAMRKHDKLTIFEGDNITLKTKGAERISLNMEKQAKKPPPKKSVAEKSKEKRKERKKEMDKIKTDLQRANPRRSARLRNKNK